MFVYIKRTKRPILINYRTEINVSPVFNSKEAQEYQQFIIIALLIIELGRVDIIYEVSLISSHLAIPRKGKMDVMMEIFVCIDKS